MTDPVFLTVRQTEEIHQRLIELHGGSEGLRDRSLFESAVAQAQNVYWYAAGDVYDIAGAYCFHLAQAQAFLDGNKRMAVAAALTFLKLNRVETNVELTAPLYSAVIEVAKHRLDRKNLAALFRTILA